MYYLSFEVVAQIGVGGMGGVYRAAGRRGRITDELVIEGVIGSIAAAALLAQAPVTWAVSVLEAPNRIVEYDAG